MSNAETPVARDLFIGGSYRSAASGKRFETRDPATGELLAEVAEAGPEDLDAAVKAARVAIEGGPWSQMTPRQRGRGAAPRGRSPRVESRRVRARRNRDNGKPIFESREDRHAGRRRGARVLRRLGRQGLSARRFRRGVRLVPLHAARAGRRRRARSCRGTFPLLLAMWKVAPALACGNTVILKPATQTPLTALALRARLAIEAGLPPGVLNVVTGPAASVGAGDRRAPGHRQDRVHRRHRRPARTIMRARRRDAQARSRWSSAASRRTSCSPTRISTPPSAARPTGSSTARARSARPARGCSSRESVHDELHRTSSSSARRRWCPAIRSIRRRGSARSSSKTQLETVVALRRDAEARRARRSSPAAHRARHRHGQGLLRRSRRCSTA